MARTKASVGSKISVGKSSKARCSVAAPPSTPSTSGTSEKSSRGHSGGNPVCPRETPKWQKPITNFFICKDSDHGSTDEEEIVRKPKTSNAIQSDDEDEPPTNKVLDETIELEPLTGEDSHKIDEYYNNNNIDSKNNNNSSTEDPLIKGKGKGKGKKTKGKENQDNNLDRKRLREDIDEEQAAKKVKVD